MINPLPKAKKSVLKLSIQHAFVIFELVYLSFKPISLPQQDRGTVQQPSAPGLQVQVFFTSNSRPQASQ